MSNKLVSTHELGRNVAKLIESKSEPGSNQTGFMNTAVSKVMATFSKYISHTIKTNNEKYIYVDIPVIGTIIVVKNPEDNNYNDDRYMFVPSVLMQQECMVLKEGIPDFPEHETLKKDLKITKIAEVSHIGVD